jgi:hypothetical protein
LSKAISRKNTVPYELSIANATLVNGMIVVRVSIPASPTHETLRLKVHDVIGRLVGEYCGVKVDPGTISRITLVGSRNRAVAPGTYVIQLIYGNEKKTALCKL